MPSLKDKMIGEIIVTEGGYVFDPEDSGGETNFGITIDVARRFGYLGEMRNMTDQIAFNIYVTMYWDSVCANDMVRLSIPITQEVVDTAVNMGVSRASKFLQRSLNALNNRGRLYPDMTVDGMIGSTTLRNLKKYLSKRDDITLAKVLNSLQGTAYVELVERREKDEKFLYGWFKNRVQLW